MEHSYIYALGYFDGVHLGHQALLSACRRAAREQSLRSGAVTFWGHPEATLTGRAPALINTASDRNRLLCQYVEQVVELPFDRELMCMPWRNFLRMLTEKHGARGFVCGADFHFGKGGQGTAPLLQAYCRQMGLFCAVIDDQLLDGVRISSTHIRKLLEDGDPEQAQRFLGHPHMLSGTVIHGKQLGRTIGFPTANMSYPDTLVRIPYGVYATVAEVDGESCPAVTNLGVRPTVSGRGVTVESFLTACSRELYGKRMTLSFLKYLRPEEKFPDLYALQKQIQADARQAEAVGREFLSRQKREE